VKALGDKLGSAILANDRAAEDERLDRRELIVDDELRGGVEMENEQRVVQLRESIKAQNLTAELLTERVKEFVWDAMDVVGARVVAFGAGAGVASGAGGGPVIHNFPLIKDPSRRARRAQCLALLRQVEFNESSLKKAQSLRPEALLADGGGLDSTGGYVASVNGGRGGGGGGGSAAPGAPGPGGEEEEEEEGARRGEGDVIYLRSEVCTLERRVIQIALVEEKAREMKRRFNSEFLEAVKKKRGVLAKIEERNARLAEIVGDLGYTPDGGGGVISTTLEEWEEPERILSVRDEEVTAEVAHF
jgi:cilia- and flagella-associated protein 43